MHARGCTGWTAADRAPPRTRRPIALDWRHHTEAVNPVPAHRVASIAARLRRGLRPRHLRRVLGRWHNYFELCRQKPRLASAPPNLILDVATMCNLRCPFCKTGNGTNRIKPGLLRPDVFAKLVARLPLARIKVALLYHWGEPLLNPHLHEYIRFFSERGIFTMISANLSAADYDTAFWDRLIDAELKLLIVSADGARQETYQKYRVGGDFQRVVGNMRALDAARKARGAQFPRTQYRMLRNRFNQGDVAEAEAIARSVGAEFLCDDSLSVPPEAQREWFADDLFQAYGSIQPTIYGRGRRSVINTECRQLWDTLTVDINGDVYPCCIVGDPAHRVGNLLEQDFEAIWNGEIMQTLRRYVTDAGAAPPPFANACNGCTHRYCLHAAAGDTPPATTP